MTAKEYLLQVKTLQFRIRMREDELQRLKREGIELKSFDYSSIRKHGFVKSDSGPELFVTRIEQREQDIIKDVEDLQEIRIRIIKQIERVQPLKYGQILYKRYIEEKNLYVIAEEMSYTYEHVSRLHTAALNAFGEEFPME